MWEALTAIGTIASAVVIAVTVVMAARQVKITTDQLNQTRRASQFEAARAVLHEMVEPKFVISYRFVINELPALLKDETFYRGVGQVGLADDEMHKELYLLRALDRIGTYVRFGLVDGEIVYGTYFNRITLSWDMLGDVVAVHRGIAGPNLYSSASFLYQDCVRWGRENGFEVDSSAALRRLAAFKTSAFPPAAGGAQP